MENLLDRRVRYDLYRGSRVFKNGNWGREAVFVGFRFGVLRALSDDFKGFGWWDNEIFNVFVEADDGIFDPINAKALRRAFAEPLKTKKIQGRFRDGPWPGNGRFRRHSHWMRYPKTTGEIAANENDLILMKEVAEEYGKTFGEGRLRRKIPHAWSEEIRHIEKNWKRQRKTQWR